MRLTDIERESRDKNTVVIGVAHAGIENIAGSIVSCAVAIDYNNVSSDLIECVIKRNLPKTINEELSKVIKIINMHEIDPIKLNSIADTTIATYLADYHALYGCVFEVFHKFSADPDYIYCESPIKEVVQNRELSLYSNKNSKSSYVVMKDWTQFDNLIPNTKFRIGDPKSIFTLMFAKACAETKLMSLLHAASQKYKQYNFNLTQLNETEEKVLRADGLTEYHRAYLPELSSFVFKKHILI